MVEIEMFCLYFLLQPTKLYEARITRITNILPGDLLRYIVHESMQHTNYMCLVICIPFILDIQSTSYYRQVTCDSCSPKIYLFILLFGGVVKYIVENVTI